MPCNTCDESKLDRRRFIMTAGMALGGLALAGCSWLKREPAEAADPNRWIVSMDEHPELKEIGGVAMLGASKVGDYEGILFVRRTGPDTALLISSKCTHQGCDVEWFPESNEFVCPCHGARYDNVGHVTRRPARQNLASWEARVDKRGVVIDSDTKPAAM